MAIIFESLEAVHPDLTTVARQIRPKVSKNSHDKENHHKQHNLISVRVNKSDLITPQDKAAKDWKTGALRSLHFFVRNKEKARGLDTGYYTNTETDEYRVFTYSPAVRQKVLSGEISIRRLKPGLRRHIREFAHLLMALAEDSDTTRAVTIGRKRPYMYFDTLAQEGEVTVARSGLLTPEPEHRPVGRPRKRPLIAPAPAEASSVTVTSSLAHFPRPELVPGSLMENVYEDQPGIVRLVAYASRCQEEYFDPTTGDEEITTHSGVVQPCIRHECHEKLYMVCEQCITTGHRHIHAHWPHLLEPALLPVCKDCTATVKAAYPGPTGYNGCTCPTSAYTLVTETPAKTVRWLCITCRISELEKVPTSKALDEEARRGIVGAGIVEGKPETVMLGRLCCCGKQLGGIPLSGDGIEGCAKRCSACAGFWHGGTTDVPDAVGLQTPE